MLRYFLNLTILFTIIITNNYCNAGPVAIQSNSHVSETDLYQFVNKLEQKVDFTKKPCDDILGFADNQDKIIDISHENYTNLNEYVETKLVNTEPKNSAERHVQDLYESCRKNELANLDEESKIKLVLKQLPYLKFKTAQDGVTSKDISRLFVKFTFLNNNPQQAMNFQNIFKDEETIKNFFKSANYENGFDEIKTFALKFAEIVRKKFLTIQVDPKNVTINSVEDLKHFFPSKNIDWDEMMNEIIKDTDLQVESSFNVFPQTIVNIMQLLIEAFDSTEPNVLHNFLSFAIINVLLTKTCNELEFFYRPVVLNNIWEENFGDLATRNRYLKFLDEIESSVKSFEEKYDLEDFYSTIHEVTENKRKVASNYKTMLPDTERDKFYKRVNLDQNMFYKNLMSVNINYRKHLMEVAKDCNVNKLEDLLKCDKLVLHLGLYDSVVASSIKNKPYVYLYVTEGYDIISEYFDKNIVTNEKLQDQCTDGSESPLAKYFTNLLHGEKTASLKLVTESFLNHVENRKSGVFEENKLMMVNDAAKFRNLNEIFFTAFIQYKFPELKIREAYFLNIIKGIPDFFETFGCTSNSKIQPCLLKSIN